MKLLSVGVSLVVVCVLMSACGGSAPEKTAETPAPAAQASPSPAPDDETLPPAVDPYASLPPEAHSIIMQPFKGDLDEMIKRRVIRAGVAINRTHYFIDKGVQRGIAYDALTLFEDELNKKLNTGLLKVHVAFIPLSRDQMGPALVDGKVDLLAAQLTVTPEREKLVAFSDPTRKNVSEIVVTGPQGPALSGLDDLSGQTVFVRKNSSYAQSVETLNARFKNEGKAPVTIKEAPPTLEDDDILEMVNAGLVPMTVVDDYMAEFWQKIFTKIKPLKTVALRTGGTLAIAVRKDNPKLLKAANDFIKVYGPESMFGKAMDRRYLQNTKYATNATSAEDRKRFQTIVEMFRKYGQKYDMDFLLMAAQGFQESRLDQNARSQVGAIGVMQIMPATGAELGVGDITQMENNINGGVKYMRQLADSLFKGETDIDPVNKGLMTFAAYNAGPGRLKALRKETKAKGLDPNKWFGNVEQVTSERIGRETVTYVSNIYKYYIAYSLVMEQANRTKGAQ
jgi:membrane-bound lytic murein transglycosylase MltF